MTYSRIASVDLRLPSRFSPELCDLIRRVSHYTSAPSPAPTLCLLLTTLHAPTFPLSSSLSPLLYHAASIHDLTAHQERARQASPAKGRAAPPLDRAVRPRRQCSGFGACCSGFLKERKKEGRKGGTREEGGGRRRVLELPGPPLLGWVALCLAQLLAIVCLFNHCSALSLFVSVYQATDSLTCTSSGPPPVCLLCSSASQPASQSDGQSVSLPLARAHACSVMCVQRLL